MKKAGKLCSVWIVATSALSTIYHSSKCIIQCYLKRPLDAINETIRTWSKSMLSIAKVNYTVHDHRDSKVTPGRACIIMSNHASLYDIPLIFMSLPGNIRMIAKKELFKVPVWGHAMKASQFISIDRKNSAQAREDLKLAKKLMEENAVIPWIAPEGTRSRDGKLGSFKAGGFLLALETNAIIIPVGIKGAGNILPPKTINFSLNQPVEIHIGEPIDTSEYDIKTRKILIKKVKERIQSFINTE